MKKFLFSLVLCFVLFTGLCVFSFAAETDLGGYELAESTQHCSGMGDVNFDKTVTAADARLILRQAVALERFTAEQKAVADLNSDAKINSADARLALRIAVKLDKQPSHSTENVLVTEATCSTQGVMAQVCTACNKVVSYSKTSVSGHLAGNWETVKPATCTEKGLKQKVCTNCKKVLEQKEITASHTFKYEDGFKGADCMNVVKAKQICTKCGYTQTKTVNPYGKHSFTWVTTKKATCSQPGLMEYKCSVCGDTGNGQTKTVTCSGVKIEQTVKAPTCTKSGISAKVCYECGEKSDEKVLPATGHDFNYNIKKVVKEPTHLETGVAQVSCKKCGETKDVEIEKLNHSTEDTGVIIKTPTCGKDGIKQVKCKYCGIVEEAIPATGLHTKSANTKTVKKATCTENEFISYYCTVCGKYEGIYTATEVKNTKLPHTPANKWTQTKAPTCTKEGTKVKYCTVCNEIALTEKVAKLAHTPTGNRITTKQASCSAEGEKVRYCAVCSQVAEKVAIAKTAHKAASTWTVTKKATCSSEGVRVIKCLKCSTALKTETIKKLNHTPGEWKTTKSPTCSNQGEKVRLCTVCKNIVETKVIAATGNHTYPNTWITTKFATCTSEGEARRYCTTDGCTVYETKATAVNPANHTSSETYKKNEKEASCSQAGYTGDIYHKCCNTLKESGKPIEKFAHTNGTLTLESFGTVNEDGTLSSGMKCIRCTVCSEITYSESFNKFIIIDSGSLFKALPESSLTNDENAVLCFEINGDTNTVYDVIYTYDGSDEPVTLSAQSGTTYSIVLADIPEDAVIMIAVATPYSE